jgi:hypothetical protein
MPKRKAIVLDYTGERAMLAHSRSVHNFALASVNMLMSIMRLGHSNMPRELEFEAADFLSVIPTKEDYYTSWVNFKAENPRPWDYATTKRAWRYACAASDRDDTLGIRREAELLCYSR